MQKRNGYHLTITFIALALGWTLSACHKTEDQIKDPVSEPIGPVPPIPPSQACKLFEDNFPSIQKALCQNPTSSICNQFGEFLQGGVPVFSATDQFAIGKEVTVPLEGTLLSPDAGRDYMILAINPKKDMPTTLGLTDKLPANADQERALQSFADGKSSPETAEFTTVTNLIRRTIDTSFVAISAPQFCPKWLYFPLSNVSDRPADVLVRQKGDKFYVLAVIYAAKREHVTNAYFSTMLTPKVLLTASPKTEAPTVTPVVETATPANEQKATGVENNTKPDASAEKMSKPTMTNVAKTPPKALPKRKKSR